MQTSGLLLAWDMLQPLTSQTGTSWQPPSAMTLANALLLMFGELPGIIWKSWFM
jgi:hypothetical protein